MRMGTLIFFFFLFFVKEILSSRLNLAFPDIGSLLREVSYLVAEKLDGVNEDKGKPRWKRKWIIVRGSHP